MRSAICLYGIVGGTEGKGGDGANIPFEECYETYKKHIIAVNNTDIFIHSWSLDVQDEIVNLYKPKKYQFEKQIQFVYNSRAKAKKIRHREIDQGFRSLSKWYSLKRSVELKTEYECENNFEYDWVMLTRFDTLFFTDLDFSKCEPDHLYVPHFNTPDGLGENPSAKLNRINRRGYGLSDMWYLADSKIVNEFTKIYDGVKTYQYRVSQHKAALDCLLDCGYKKDVIKYTLWRHYDFELYRWVLGNLYSKGDRDASKK